MPIKFYEPIDISEIEGEKISEDKKGEPFDPNRKGYAYEMISSIHRRSFQDTELSGHVLWGDEYGTRFMSRSVKGIPPEGKLPWLEFDSCTTSGFRIHYLCDEIDARNTENVSRILRSQGMPTERIVRTYKLESLGVTASELNDSDFEILEKYNISSSGRSNRTIEIPVDALKEIMIGHLDRAIIIRDKSPETFKLLPPFVQSLANYPPEKIEEVKEHLLKTSFNYYERDMPSDERCIDLDFAEYKPESICYVNEKGIVFVNQESFESIDEFCGYVEFLKRKGVKLKGFEEMIRLQTLLVDREVAYGDTLVLSSDINFRRVLSNIFRYLNTAEGFSLDIENPEDIKYFYTELQPRRMGEYLGRLHNQNLTHSYPGDKNWLAVGYLIDLDSVSGESLGDAAVTDEKRNQDIYQTLACFYNQREDPEFILQKNTKTGQQHQVRFHGQLEQLLGSEITHEMGNTAYINFFRSYMKTRNLDVAWLQNLIENDKKIGEIGRIKKIVIEQIELFN